MKILLTLAAGTAVLAGALTFTQRSEAQPGVPSLVWWLDNPVQVSGEAVPDAYTIEQRGYFSITYRWQTSGLTPGHNYSVWWVIFQNPGSCSGGHCGDDDINAVIGTGANPVGIGVHFGGTFAAPESGSIGFTTRILEDVVDTCAKALPYSLVCAPLRDAATASALVFLVDHGPAVSGGPATATFDANCSSLVWFGYVVANYNKGDYACYRAQSTYHMP
jgi:hypothetical protein